MEVAVLMDILPVVAVIAVLLDIPVVTVLVSILIAIPAIVEAAAMFATQRILPVEVEAVSVLT
jgi:hypothetical protein